MSKRIAMIVLGLALAASSLTALAAEPAPKYGVLSLIGDKLNVVGYQTSTGTRLDPNRASAITVPDSGFDATALRTVEEAVKRLGGPNEVMLYAISAPKLVDNPTALFDGDKLVLAPALVDGMRKDGATHLLLLTRHRQEAQLRAANAWLGVGRLEGLGYYIDLQQGMTAVEDGEPMRGFIAPYVYLRLSLVDLGNLRILRQKTITASDTIAARRKQESANSNPWTMLTANEKLDTLNRMIGNEMKEAVPALLATP